MKLWVLGHYLIAIRKIMNNEEGGVSWVLESCMQLSEINLLIGYK